MNFLAKVAYVGAAYKGFERQKDFPTIQGKLEEALSFFFQEKITIHGSGRTDAGVNAKGQTFSFERTMPFHADKFLHVVNSLLPNDIAVLSLTKVADSFDARKSATGKRYSYSFRLGDKRPFEAYEVTQLGHRTLNEDNFQAALSLMKGTHDFRDFTSKAQDKYDFRRTIYDLDVSVDEEGLHRVSFLGNGFMTYQVRIMMGVALKVGMGKMTVEQVKAALDPKERKIISFKAPAEGLCLEEVYYEPIH